MRTAPALAVTAAAPSGHSRQRRAPAQPAWRAGPCSRGGSGSNTRHTTHARRLPHVTRVGRGRLGEPDGGRANMLGRADGEQCRKNPPRYGRLAAVLRKIKMSSRDQKNGALWLANACSRGKPRGAPSAGPSARRMHLHGSLSVRQFGLPTCTEASRACAGRTVWQGRRVRAWIGRGL